MGGVGLQRHDKENIEHFYITGSMHIHGVIRPVRNMERSKQGHDEKFFVCPLFLGKIGASVKSNEIHCTLTLINNICYCKLLYLSELSETFCLIHNFLWSVHKKNLPSSLFQNIYLCQFIVIKN